MRKLFALAIAVFFVLQSTAALAAPVEHCCLEDCRAAACDVLTCSACVAPAAVGSHATEAVIDFAALIRSGDEAVLPSAAEEVWRPPG